MVRDPFQPAVIFVLIMVVLGGLNLAGQADSELGFMLKSNPLRKAQPPASRAATPGKPPAAEMRAVLLGMISIYQSYISTQDEDSCSYTKTCSAFSTEAIRDFGLLKGLLMTSDRLLRCHPLARRYHPADAISRLAIDLPVRAYSLGSKRGR
jgi:putative membrane protein insertion efficiency factor